MSTVPALGQDATRLPGRRLTLKVSTPQNIVQTGDTKVTKEESSSPVRPSYSPVTPTLSHATLTTKDAPQQWIDEPEPLPVSLDDNPDAIALRATISILQMQRQQTLRDIRNLDKTKQAALNDPEAFTTDLREGKLHKPETKGIIFDDDDVDSDAECDENQHNEHKELEAAHRFAPLPNAQNVARCPPIEWSKYHIIGEPLERLHQLQKEYPGLTEEALAKGLQPKPHEIAAPYRPFVDKINQPPSAARR